MEAAGLIVAIVALLVAWLSWAAARRANRISGASNDIARRALDISEAEHTQRERDRRARARLSVTLEPGPNHEVSDDGTVWTTAGSIITSLVITLVNSGDRASGKTLVDVWVPRMPGGDPYWAEAPGGVELPGLPKATPDPKVRLNLSGDAHIYDSARLSRTLDSVAVDLPERMFLRAPFVVGDREDAYPVDVVVGAEGADAEARTRAVIRIKRR